jgi:DNA-binding response OmpR family regulator
LRLGLSAHGYQVLEAPNGKTALELLGKAPDLIILDLGLPDTQGHDLLRTIRARNERVPIVVLSSRGDEAGKVQALDLGADDYVTKPFGMDELLARMRAALRHQLQTHGERPIFRVGELSVDLVRRIVKTGDKEIKLSPKEYDLLRVLVQHAGKVQALDLGADDYVTKPFGMDELLARMRAALRHQLQTHGERPIFRVGELSVDLVRRIVKVGDKEIKLSPKEYDLLRALVQHAGKVLTHKFLLGELWDDLTDAQYLRVYVRQLRQKIEADPERPHYILTETGIGYRLRAPD